MSLGPATTEADVDALLEVLPGVVDELREVESISAEALARFRAPEALAISAPVGAQLTVHVSPECSSVPRSPLPSRSVARASCVVHRLAVDRALELAEHADGGRLGRAVRQVRQRERERRAAVHVVHDDRVCGHVGRVRDHQPAVLPHHDASGALVEHDRLAVHQTDLVVHALGFSRSTSNAPSLNTLQF